MRPAFLARTAHKWASLIIGLQVVIWLVTGLYMVIVDLDFIHGDPLVRNMDNVIPLSDISTTSLAEYRERYPEATAIELRPVLGQLRVAVSTPDSRVLIDPETSTVVSPLDEQAARKIARFHYDGTAQVLKASLIESDPPGEIGPRRLPLWRVDFSDRFATSFYIDPFNGALVTRRHRYWRLFDFFWMLHIMDYDERTDVHNPLLRTAQFAGLLAGLSGMWLLYYRLFRRRGRRAD